VLGWQVLLVAVVVGAAIDLARAGRLLVGGPVLPLRPLGMFLSGELGLLGASGADLGLLPKSRRFFAPVLEPASSSRDRKSDRNQYDGCRDHDYDAPCCAHDAPGARGFGR